MTPHQFWFDDPDDLWAYVSAYEQKEKDKIKYDNICAYNQGYYFLLAIYDGVQFGKNHKKIYPKKPLISECEKKQLTQKEYEEIRKIQLKNLVDRFDSSTKSKK